MDDGLLQGLVGFGGGFLKGMENAEDRKLKRMEFEAKMKAAQADDERKDFQNQIEALKIGYRKDKNAPGGFAEVGPSPMKKSELEFSSKEKGLLPPTYDEHGVPHPGEYDPKSPQMVGAKNRQINADAARGSREESLAIRKDTVDRREHERVLSRINSNPNIKQRLQQYQNLQNSLNLLANADHITPQQFHEAQQAIRSNLGIKGTSGIAERDETYLKSIGLNAEAFKQFLTGDPGNISPNDPLLLHVKNLAALEQQNILKQFGKSLKAASAGHESMYTRRPDLMEDLQYALSAQGDQISDKGLLGTSPASAPQKVRVSNGKETLEIDPNDLGAAQADGYRPVK